MTPQVWCIQRSLYPDSYLPSSGMIQAQKRKGSHQTDPTPPECHMKPEKPTGGQKIELQQTSGRENGIGHHRLLELAQAG